MPHTLHDLSPIFSSRPFLNIYMRNKAISIIQKSTIFSKREKKRIIRSNFFLSASTYRKPYKGYSSLEIFNNILAATSKQLFVVATHIPENDRDIFMKKNGIIPGSRANNEELAALYVLSYAAIHMSKFEGGINVAPFSEAVSVGRPCIFITNSATEEARINSIKLGAITENSKKGIEKTIKYLQKNYQQLLNNQIDYYIQYSRSYTDNHRNLLWEKALDE